MTIELGTIRLQTLRSRSGNAFFGCVGWAKPKSTNM